MNFGDKWPLTFTRFSRFTGENIGDEGRIHIVAPSLVNEPSLSGIFRQITSTFWPAETNVIIETLTTVTDEVFVTGSAKSTSSPKIRRLIISNTENSSQN